MPTLDEIASDPEYLALPERERARVRSAYLQMYSTEDVARQAGSLTPESIASATQEASTSRSSIPQAIARALRERFVEPFQRVGLLAPPENAALESELPGWRPPTTPSEATAREFAAFQPAAGTLAMFGTAGSPGVRMASQYRSAPFGRPIQPTEVLGPELAVRAPRAAPESAFTSGAVPMPRRASLPGLVEEAVGGSSIQGRPASSTIPETISAATSRPVPSGGIDPAPIFYSQLARTIDQKMPNRAAPEQVSAIARSGGVKEDEIKWTGLDEWLKEQKGPVSKQDVANFLRASQVTVQEVSKGGSRMPYADWLWMKFRLKPADVGQAYVNLYETEGAQIQGGPKFSTWQLPGGQNYRELLLTLPYEAPFRDFRAFRTSHWDEPNVLAHVRFNERTDAQGKRVLFIEEIQSDWHQAGRKVGYAKNIPQLQKSVEETGRLVEASKDEPGYIAAQTAHMDAIEALHAAKQGVPPAPFAKTWHELVLKRMLRWAAEKGFDRVAWVTGEQTAARYDLSKQVDRIGWASFPDGTFSLYAEKGNEPIGSFLRVKADELDRYIGKDAAEKVRTFQGQSTRFTPETMIQGAYRQGQLDAVDLKIGGEWAKHLYDEMIPQFLNKYGKKWGARVGETNFPNLPLKEASSLGEAATVAKYPEQIRVHSLDITPEMKHSVMFQGQPLFALIPPLIASAALASQRRGERDRQPAGARP